MLALKLLHSRSVRVVDLLDGRAMLLLELLDGGGVYAVQLLDGRAVLLLGLGALRPPAVPRGLDLDQPGQGQKVRRSAVCSPLLSAACCPPPAVRCQLSAACCPLRGPAGRGAACARDVLR